MGCQKKTKKTAEEKSYGWTSLMAIAINYIIGTGMLALPAPVGRSSVFMSLVLLILAMIMAILPAIASPDMIARGFALRNSGHTYNDRLAERRRLRRAKKAGESTLQPARTVSSSGAGAGGLDRPESVNSSVLMDVRPDSRLEPKPAVPSSVPVYDIPCDEEMVASELMRVFFGEAGFYIYQISIIIYMLTTVWSYGNVVSSSLTSVIPFYGLPAFNATKQKIWICGGPCQPNYYEYCNQAYWIWICITFVFSQTMVFFDLSEQKVMQTIFTYCRFLVLILAIVIAAIALGISPYAESPARLSPPYQSPSVAILAYNSSAVGNLFGLIVFSLIFHYAIPSLVKPLRKAEHDKLTRIFVITYAVIFTVSMLIMFIDGPFFGGNSASLVTLNFTLWDGTSWTNATNDKAWWAFLISYVVRLLPPIYVLTAIPINSLVMAENIRAIFSKRLQQNVAVMIFTRILAVVPALLLAGFVRCLNVILNYAGLVGFIIMTCPVVMAHAGRRQCRKIFGQQYELTPYTVFVSCDIAAGVYYFLVLVEFCIVLYALIVPT